MIGFEQYEEHLSGLLEQSIVRGAAPSSDALLLALDGQPGRVLRLVAEQEALDGAGAFFTGQRLASQLIEPWERELKGGKIRLFDAACGAGDLLLAVARCLPVQPKLSTTLIEWGRILSGCDIHPTFVRTSKLRLALLASQRCPIRDKVPPLNRLFPGIRCGDFFRGQWLEGMTHIVMNPPFTLANALPSCQWAQGLVNQAGVFVQNSLVRVSSEVKIAAILPDVLRTGSRYRRWRDSVQDLAAIRSIKVSGRFDAVADVDVFFLHLQRQTIVATQSIRWWGETDRTTIGDFFRVNVGSVVPHRDPLRGDRAPFFDTGCTPVWKVLREPTRWRKHSGRLFIPPFVVVRRTSSPSDNHRACASIVATRSAAAIENHLLVLTPKDGTIKACRALMKSLKQPAASRWLNKRIRCRHLTVGAVSKIPFSKETA
jgi:hypothetical protein